MVNDRPTSKVLHLRFSGAPGTDAAAVPGGRAGPGLDSAGSVEGWLGERRSGNSSARDLRGGGSVPVCGEEQLGGMRIDWILRGGGSQS